MWVAVLTLFYFSVALEETYWTSSEQLEALKHLNETDFLHFASHLMDAVSVKCFVHGNVDKQLVAIYFVFNFSSSCVIFYVLFSRH